MEKITYEWVKSNRKTIAIQIKEDGRVVVRTPYSMSRVKAEQFIEERRDWILKNQKALKEKQDQKMVITQEMRKAGVEKAMEIFPKRVEYYARLMGISYGRITIREQKTRWGSCSGRGNLNFNWKLTLMPPEILDYVVVHELAHRKEMNHSKDFWKIVEQVLPDYQKRRKRLKELAMEI
ncbi:MAG: M48 family metallopeptidase [Dorea sp.]|nr:M48 family metallopeptidase [Dorea sp.]